MIVVDSNIIAYCWLNAAATAQAQAVRVRDPEWHVPVLWRSELRSILAGYLREGSLSRTDVIRVMRHIEEELDGAEHLVASEDVFRVIQTTPLSAYDSEFVALARALAVPLVTEDRAILRACPDEARSMAAFLESS